MTYKQLTVDMINSVKSDGFIDQTVFKTNEKYAYDSLHFDGEVINQVMSYITNILPKLNPLCPYLLITCNGSQQTQLYRLFGNIVYGAIGKYIHPTRFRQVIETESAEALIKEEQSIISEDQKHSSRVANVHYKKRRSHSVSMRSKSLLKHLVSSSTSEEDNTHEKGLDEERLQASISKPRKVRLK